MLTQIWIFAVAEQLMGANGPFWHVDRVQPQSSFSFRDTDYWYNFAFFSFLFLGHIIIAPSVSIP